MGKTTSFGALFAKAKEEGAFDDAPLPEGDFEVTLVRANAKTTAKKDESIGVQAKITGGVEEDDEAFGKTAWLNLNFSTKAQGISFRQLRSWGFDDDYLSETESAEQIAEAIPGIVLDVSVTHRTWGDNDENTNTDLKVHEVLVPPAIGAVASAGALDPGSDAPEPF